MYTMHENSNSNFREIWIFAPKDGELVLVFFCPKIVGWLISFGLGSKSDQSEGNLPYFSRDVSLVINANPNILREAILHSIRTCLCFFILKETICVLIAPP